MSFHISFTARTIASARQKLHEAHAPACVKAMIEAAINSIAAHPHSQQGRAADEAKRADATRAQTSVSTQAAPLGSQARSPEFCGVFVETSGHMAEPIHYDSGKSWIDRFVVQALFD